jgi:hypothetical protein
MSIKLMSAIWENPPVSGSSLLMLLALADNANDQGMCWPSIKYLAHKCALSERQAQRDLRELETKGLLRTEQRKSKAGDNCSNLYTLLPSPPNEGVDAPPVSTVTPPSANHVTLNHQLTPNEPLQNPSTDSAPSGPDAPPPLREVFREIHERLGKTKNRQAVLRQAYVNWFGDGDVPDYGRLGAVARQVGGAGRLLELMFQLVPRPPTGDILAYILAAYGPKARRGDSGVAHVYEESGEAIRRYMEKANGEHTIDRADV